MQLPMLVVVLVLVMLLLRLVLPSLRLGLSKWLCLSLMRALPVFQLMLQLVSVLPLLVHSVVECRWKQFYVVACTSLVVLEVPCRPMLVCLLMLEECQVCVLLVVSACGLLVFLIWQCVSDQNAVGDSQVV